MSFLGAQKYSIRAGDGDGVLAVAGTTFAVVGRTNSSMRTKALATLSRLLSTESNVCTSGTARGAISTGLFPRISEVSAGFFALASKGPFVGQVLTGVAVAGHASDDDVGKNSVAAGMAVTQATGSNAAGNVAAVGVGTGHVLWKAVVTDSMDAIERVYGIVKKHTEEMLWGMTKNIYSLYGAPYR